MGRPEYRSRVDSEPTAPQHDAGRSLGGASFGEISPETLSEAAHEIEEATRGSVRQVLLRVGFLLFMLVSLYVFAPQLADVYGQIDVISRIEPLWLIAIVVLQALSFVCMWVLQRLALRTHQWFSVATSQLAGNAFSRVVPAGAAAGVALQFSMLSNAGIDTTTAASSLTVVSLLTTASVFALPIFALPTILAGAPVPRSLMASAWLGLLMFLVLAAIGVLVAATDRPLCWIAETGQRLHNRVLHKRQPMTGLPERLLDERNLVRSTLDSRKGHAIFATSGRVLFDYLSLIACLAAIGGKVTPSLVLLAYVAASVLTMIPITPGGLGFVEAGLTGTLVLAGVSGGDALLATALYRLASFWLPMPAGLGAWIAFRVHVRRGGLEPSTQ